MPLDDMNKCVSLLYPYDSLIEVKQSTDTSNKYILYASISFKFKIINLHDS